MSPSQTPAARLIYLVTEDWYFVSHRLPMARAAQRAGFEVHVATRVHEHGYAIEREGFVLHPLGWRRGSIDPLHILSMIRDIRNLYRRVQPKIVHHVALVPTIVGSIAVLGLPVISVNALAGLGFTFTSQTSKARILRLTVERILLLLLNRDQSTTLVQNPDDRAALESLGLPKESIALIPGSGVDIGALAPLSEPSPPITIGFVGRLIKDKGLPELIEAHKLLRKRGHSIQLFIAGEPDPANPASIPASQIEGWKQQSGVFMLGHVQDISQFWTKAHIAVLPSHREGLPLSLLEAAACGRPIVATDVPGCREIARENINALTVPPRNAPALADAIERLSQDPQLRRRFGAAGRALVEREFSNERVGGEIVALYEYLLKQHCSRDA